jgi:hypothetical protein
LTKFGHAKHPNQSVSDPLTLLIVYRIEQSLQGFSLANNTNLGLYEELKKWPERQERWNSAMSAMALQIDFDFLVRSHPWTSYPPGTIIADVGGGIGTVSVGLAERLPHLRFIVQDNLETICEAQALTPLLDRVHYQEYDFFTEQTYAGAQVYYFRNIFHNWPDEQCIQIFRNHVPVMRPTTKLLIDDFTLHDPLTVSPFEERQNR